MKLKYVLKEVKGKKEEKYLKQINLSSSALEQGVLLLVEDACGHEECEVSS